MMMVVRLFELRNRVMADRQAWGSRIYGEEARG